MATGGGATSVGGLIIELRANTAQFHAEMEAARKGLKGTGDAAHGAGRQLSRFAAIAASELVPGLEGSRAVLQQIIQTAPRAAIALAGVGATGAILAAVGVAAVGVGTAIAHLGGQRTWIDNWREAGQVSDGLIDRLKLMVGLTGAYEERVKKAGEEEKKFNDELRAAGAIRAEFAKQLAQGRGDINARGRQFTGDDEGAAHAELDTRIEIIELERKARERNILQQFKDEKRRLEFLKSSEQIASQDRTRAYLDASLKMKKIDEDAAQKRIDTWQKETSRLVEQLKARVQARQAFEAQLGTGAQGVGLGGSSLADVTAAGKANKAARDMAAVIESPGFRGSASLSVFAGITAADIAQVRALDDAWRDVVTTQEAYQRALQGRAGATQGFKAITDFQESIKKATQDLAFNQRGGQISSRDSVEELERIRQAAVNSAGTIEEKFGHIPAVMEALARATDSVRFGNLGKEMAAARIEIDRTVPTAQALEAEASKINQAFLDMPTVTDQAAESVKKLKAEFNDLAWQIFGATQQLAAYEQQIAGGTQ